MAIAQVFSVTSNISKAFASTFEVVPFFETSGNSKAFLSTFNTSPFFTTSGVASAFISTFKPTPFFNTSGKAVSFVVTPSIDNAKLLVLKFAPLDIASDYSTITMTDGTGLYDAVTNPNGYNLPVLPSDINRAKRSQVNLYFVYRVWTGGSPKSIVFPVTQYPTLDTWEYTLEVPASGIYQLMLVATPLAFDYTDVQSKGNSIYDLAKAKTGWFASSIAVAADADLINCLNQKRYAFLEEVMCGHCDEGYLEFYSDYVGMLNALDLLDQVNATILYDKLKSKCSEVNCDCGC